MLQPFPPGSPAHTFVAEVVLAASSIAWWALRAGAASLVWGFSNPVPPGRTGAMHTHQTPTYPTKPLRLPGTKGVDKMGVSAVLILG